MKRIVAVLFSAALAISLAGCGRKTPEITRDTGPFKAAIEEYCKAKNFGMAVDSFDSMEIKDKGGTVTCKMKEAEGTYNMTVKWQFTVEEKDGKWKVSSHVVK